MKVFGQSSQLGSSNVVPENRERARMLVKVHEDQTLEKTEVLIPVNVVEDVHDDDHGHQSPVDLAAEMDLELCTLLRRHGSQDGGHLQASVGGRLLMNDIRANSVLAAGILTRGDTLRVAALVIRHCHHVERSELVLSCERQTGEGFFLAQ